MSFSSLRPNSIIYILNREGLPSVEQGQIVNVSAPTPKYGAQQPYPTMPFMGQQPEMVVDLTVKVGDKTGPFNKVPAQSDVFDCTPTMMLSTSREAINAELVALRQQSVDVINSCSFHEQRKQHIDKLMGDLNPEIAEKQVQAQEIANLKQQMSELMAMNKQLIASIQQQNTNGSGEPRTKNKN